MGKVEKFIKRFFTGKKKKEKSLASHDSGEQKDKNSKTILNSALEIILKEKRRWSFGRSSAASKEAAATVQLMPMEVTLNSGNDWKKHSVVMLLTPDTNGRPVDAIEEAAATKIQSVFRAHLARKALRALKGLVKLQALVKGYLVRKQAAATLRRMEALAAAQARAREQRIQLSEEKKGFSQSESVCVKLTKEKGWRHTNNETVGDIKENIKIVEMDEESIKSSHCQSHQLQTERAKNRLSSSVKYSKPETYQLSPSLTELSFRTYCNRFKNYSICGTQCSPQCHYAASNPSTSWSPLTFQRIDYAAYDLPLYPSYMGNTESSRAKVRAQSAPKQRLDSFKRPPTWRRASSERRNVPRGVKIQRSPSLVSHRSSLSRKDAECGSSSKVLENTNYCWL